MADTVWIEYEQRVALLADVAKGLFPASKDALRSINRKFTLPAESEQAKVNLKDIWFDSKFQSAIPKALNSTSNQVRFEAVQLLRHLTYHEEVLPSMWASDSVRPLLLSAAKMCDVPGEENARVQSMMVLHNLATYLANVRSMWENARLREVVVEAAACSKQGQSPNYRKSGLKVLACLLADPVNVDSIKAHNAACAALQKAHKQMKAKDDVELVANALETLGLLAHHVSPTAEDSMARSIGEGFIGRALSAEDSAASSVEDQVDELLVAAENNDIERARQVLAQRPCSVLAKGADDYTPLLWAAYHGNLTMATLLLAHDAVVDARDCVGSTPLGTAAWNGHSDCVRLLLNHRADPTLKNNGGKTALMAADSQGHKESKKLIETELANSAAASSFVADAAAAGNATAAAASSSRAATPTTNPAAGALPEAAEQRITLVERGWCQKLLDLLPTELPGDEIDWLQSKAGVRALLERLETSDESYTPKLLRALMEKVWQVVKGFPEEDVEQRRAFSEAWSTSVDSVIFPKLKEAAAKLPTLFVRDERCTYHLGEVKEEDGILDIPQRIDRARDAFRLAREGRSNELVEVDFSQTELDERHILEICRLAHTDKYVLRIHTKLSEVESDASSRAKMMGSVISGHDVNAYGTDLDASKGTKSACLAGLHAVMRSIDAVLERRASNVFAAIRPPGHHVGRDGRTEAASTQGFCFYNNVAVGAKYAVNKCGLQRVCVIDFDVHHGNGTEEILRGDPHFLFVSSHAYDPYEDQLYPCTGGDSSGNVINVTLSRHFKGIDLWEEWRDENVDEKIRAFQPQLILLSSGFDAHKFDHSEYGGLDTNDYGDLTERLLSLAWSIDTCYGRLVSVLEGGYNTSNRSPKKPLLDAVKIHLDKLVDGKKPSVCDPPPAARPRLA